MAKKHRRKKRSVFFPIYWTIVILAVAAIGLSLRLWLWEWCAEYEQSQSVHAAEEYIRLFEKGDVSQMLALAGDENRFSLRAYEAAPDYENYVRSVLEGRTITCKQDFAAGEGDSKTYIVKADGARFASFTIKKSGKTEKFGMDLWEYDGMILDIPAPETQYNVKVLSNYDVYVNGVQLDESYITQRDIPTFGTSVSLPSSAYRPEYVVYTFPIRFVEPEISVCDAGGNVGVLIADEETEHSWHMDLEYSDATAKPKMHEYVLKAAKAYALFISEDGSRAGAMQYVLKGSAMEKRIKNYDDKWFTPHKAYTISYADTWNYYKFSDTCFCVDVQYVFTISASNGNKQAYPSAFRFYFGYDSGKDSWLIFDYESIEFDQARAEEMARAGKE